MVCSTTHTANEVDCGIARGYEGSILSLHFFTPQGVVVRIPHLLRFPVSVTSLFLPEAMPPGQVILPVVDVVGSRSFYRSKMLNFLLL